MLDKEPVADLDAVWLQMETDKQAMMITTILRFASRFPIDLLQSLVVDKILRYEKFSSRYVKASLPGLSASWQRDSNFSVHSHLHHIFMKQKFSHSSLYGLLSELASTALEREKPLWQMHLVDYEDEGSFLLIRMHHALADGLALLHLLEDLTDEQFFSHLPSVGVDCENGKTSAVEKLWKVFNRSLSFAHLVSLSIDPPSCFKSSLGLRKLLSWSDAFDLNGLKVIARKIDGTVSDVLIGITAGAMRRILTKHGNKLTDIRAILPVAISDRLATMNFGNHLGLVFLDLPVTIDQPWSRLLIAKENLEEIKASQEAQVASAILSLMGATHPYLAALSMNFFVQKASLMLTSVPGPPVALHIAGIKLEDIVIFAPTASRLALGMSFMSYAGKLRLGVSIDASLGIQAEDLTQAFTDEWQHFISPADVKN
ncbi:MAG: WS/DGAT domain-containing protein [Oligoflexus sp.]